MESEKKDEELQTGEAYTEYASTEELRKVFEDMKGQKFMLDCGHKVTFGYFLANNLAIINGKKIKIICSECSY